MISKFVILKKHKQLSILVLINFAKLQINASQHHPNFCDNTCAMFFCDNFTKEADAAVILCLSKKWLFLKLCYKTE